MDDDVFLLLVPKSGLGCKYGMGMENTIGVIDSDYYNNASTEGHIMFQFTNVGLRDVTIKKGERIGQGIFLPFLKADQDETTGERTGGFGSSDK